MSMIAPTAPIAVGDEADGTFRGQRAVIGPVAQVRLADLVPGDSPRHGPEDVQHVEVLAAVETRLPPILVHQPSLRVIDGMHRVQAAMSRGRTTIEAEFFYGSVADAFVEAVRRNIAHGKPLTRAERETAATRLLETHHALSDRSLAELCGLSPKTVAALRAKAGNSLPVVAKRLGRDGRLRPIDTSSARREAARIFQERPDATAREVAREVGIAPATVADVKRRLERGESPYPRGPRFSFGATPADAPAKTTRRTDMTVVTDDRALTSTDEGRELVGWLTEHAVGNEEWWPFVEAVPLSRIYAVSRVAREFAQSWISFAEALERRPRGR